VLRWLTAGESHGAALTAVLEGMVAGVSVSSKEVSAELARRRLGYGRGARMAFEADEIELSGGLRHGLTMGGPIAIRIANSEWPKWETVMSADPVDPVLLEGRSFLARDILMDCDSMLLVEGRFGAEIEVDGMSFLT